MAEAKSNAQNDSASAKARYQQQLRETGEKFQTAWQNGTIQDGLKGLAVKGLIGAGGIQALAMVANGAWLAVGGLLGLETLSHKVGEKFFTHKTHNNVIVFDIELISAINNLLKSSGRTISDVTDIAEARALAEAAMPLVAEARRKKIDRAEKVEVAPAKKEVET